MKTTLYRSESRGVGEAGWLHSRFSFSFANYFNPARMGFGALRVLNDDVIEGGGGFGMHPHRDMEIVTIVTSGTLEHQDSEGNRGVLTRGDVQVMSAGSGIEHSEYNKSDTELLALFQLWIETKEKGIQPQYDQKRFAMPDNALMVVASGLGDRGALSISQDARVVLGQLPPQASITYRPDQSRGTFAFMIEGGATVAGVELARRDALEVTDTDEIPLTTETGCEVLLIEVPLR